MEKSSNKYSQLNLDNPNRAYPFEELKKDQFLKLTKTSSILGTLSFSSIVLSVLLIKANTISPIPVIVLIGFVLSIIGIISGLVAFYKSTDLDEAKIELSKSKMKVSLLVNFVSFLIILSTVLFLLSVMVNGR
ncbi:MAG: hypothetical protein HY819_24890 [Acidobacteria bacterium]|nr:hypothetical protein [Acidobacteriota bacterium]